MIKRAIEVLKVVLFSDIKNIENKIWEIQIECDEFHVGL